MIHPTAIIDPDARIAPNVDIGPYSVIGAGVELGSGCRIGSHVVIKGPTRIGRDNQIFQFASIGEAPQDKKYGGEPTRLEIGDRNVIRESVSIHRGTVNGGAITRVGNDNLIMIGGHIAHDCKVGNHTIFANNATLAGHVAIEDYVILGGATLVRQFCSLGIHSFTAGGSLINKDVPPFVLVSGQMARPYGLNVEGLKRRGFEPEVIRKLRLAYKYLYRSNLTLDQALRTLWEMEPDCPEIGVMARFIERSQHGIVR